MNPDNESTIRRFYDAFAKRDGETMAACYADDAAFSDPVFPELKGDEVGSMWKMLCERGKDLEITYSDVEVDGDSGRARWEAHYTFSGTGRHVHNRIQASFRFRDGKIVEHTDDFDFWSWTRMALGLPGVLLGWSPMIRNKVRATAAKSLQRGRAKD